MRKLLLVVALYASYAWPQDRRVVLVSVDGLRPDFYLDPAAHGAELPTFRDLMRDGVYAEAVMGTYPSVTYPSHTSIVTGARPNRHGIVNNYVFDASGKFDDWYWHVRDIEAPALWDVAEGATAAVHWPVTVGAAIDYNLPEYWVPGSDASWRDVRAEVTTPALLASIESELGRLPDEPIDEEPLENFTFDVAELILERFRPHLLLVHVINVDTQQHRHGREHPEVVAAFERVDARLGRLRRKLVALGMDDTLLVVTGDHGFIETHSWIHVNSLLREAGLLEVGPDGAITSYRALAWPAGGSCAIVLKDAGDEATRARVQTLVDDILVGPLGGVMDAVSDDVRRAHGAMPDVVIMLDARDGYIFGKNVTGPALTPSEDLGFHGYLPDRPKMMTGFLMAGPGVRAGVRVPEMRQIDIAPTIAHWAGWELGDVDGLALRGLFDEVAP